MIIGLDFDNTIVSYDALFHRVAVDEGLIAADCPPRKSEIRDRLRAEGREDRWTELQGQVYGERMGEAAAFPGALDFFRGAATRGIPLRIVSHRTKSPFLGKPWDLHAAALSWIEGSGLLGWIAREDIYFELTKAAKIARIQDLGCTHFVDDLPELLGDPSFPGDVARFHFDPAGHSQPQAAWKQVRSWAELAATIFADAS